eukprot:gnl/MRDRNA2_/MRDRNA2_59810_c0_seq1.p2 gnl/MRDRNA2_/MRDRNA2_59810_c0~~gnl/MRDRNA2_/MRDRNA2_59810_c0_seq1.p2  ORF type:complete len:170 (+),score=41.66 gnl/MRDRNA2_/MRDRNA2_59810_c0_seq1:790-1299(+)
MYALSRAVKKGERIDFFISHSWHDDGEAKWKVLVAFVEEFRRQRSRDPTFWLDICCMNQQELSDGLRVLPINLMSCNKMLVLMGETYATRLWCAWELVTIFSFMREEFAQQHVIVKSLLDKADSAQRFKNFDVMKAHCYDPNEEAFLRLIIQTMHVDLNARIRKLHHLL